MKGRASREELDDASGSQQKEKATVKDRTGETKKLNSKSVVQQIQPSLIPQDVSETSTDCAQLKQRMIPR